MSDYKRLLTLTSSALYSDIWKLAWPVMLGNGLHMVFNLVDTFWVSRLGAVHVAIPALAGSLLWMFMSLGETISIGTASMIARLEGAGRRDLLGKIVGHSFWLGLAMAIVIAVIMWAFTEPLLLLFTDDPLVLPLATSYVRITALGMLFVFTNLAIASTLNGVGDTLTPMLVMMATNAVNLVLDPLLIFGWLGFPALGVLGAAWATFAANAVALVVLLYKLFRRRELGVTSLFVAFDFSIFANLLRIGFPACLQSAARSSTGTVMFWLVMSGYGPAAAAAFGAGQRVVGLIFIFLSGLAVASTTLIGQVLGLGDRALAWLAARRLIILGVVVQVTIGLTYFALARPISALFLADDAVALAAGISYMRICGLGLALGASTSVLGGIFKGAGYTMPTFYAGFAANWLVKLPMAAIATLVLALPVDGIWWAIFASIVVEWGILMFWLQRGTWVERDLHLSDQTA